MWNYILYNSSRFLYVPISRTLQVALKFKTFLLPEIGVSFWISKKEILKECAFRGEKMRDRSSLVLLACMYYFRHTKHLHTADNSTGVQPPIQRYSPSCITMELDACFPLVQMQGPHVRSGQLGSDRAWLGSIGEVDTHASRRTVQVMCMYEPVHSHFCTSSETK